MASPEAGGEVLDGAPTELGWEVWAGPFLRSVKKRSIVWHLVCNVKHVETRAPLLAYDGEGVSQAEARTFFGNISVKVFTEFVFKVGRTLICIHLSLQSNFYFSRVGYQAAKTGTLGTGRVLSVDHRSQH